MINIITKFVSKIPIDNASILVVSEAISYNQSLIGQ